MKFNTNFLNNSYKNKILRWAISIAVGVLFQYPGDQYFKKAFN
jgi:hypothetical protein